MRHLLPAVALLLLSLLVLFRAPTGFFWKVAIGITEFPYVPILVSLLFFICSWRSAGHYKIAALLLTGLSLALFCLPVLQAYRRAAKLGKEFNTVFPTAPLPRQLPQPYSFLTMLKGIGISKVTPRSLTYKKGLQLDFYPAAIAAKAPCVIVIHGGSWAGGDSKQLPDLNSYLAGLGYHVAAVNYGLAPQHRSPSQVNDIKDAIEFLVRESDHLKIDTARLVLLGRSAGAQIALVSAYSSHHPGIRGVISFYGPADMVWGGRTRANPLVLDTDEVFKNYLGGTIDEVPEKYSEASACGYVNSTSPPTLLIHGANDAMVSYRHSVRLDKKLSRHGVKHYFLDLPWATHGCDYNINGPSGQLSTFAIERFINSVIH